MSDLTHQHFSVPPDAPPIELWGAGLRHCIILGMGSDIAGEIRQRLQAEGWTVNGRSRAKPTLPTERWDMLIVAQGTMKPIGKFFECDASDWEDALYINAIEPLRDIRKLWPQKRMGAKVVFMSGPNPNVTTPTYTAYRASKAIMQSLVATLNEEESGATFHWFIPGIFKSKIHQESIEAGERCANIAKVHAVVHGEWPTADGDTIYARFKAAIA